jgi:hypothetical protein
LAVGERCECEEVGRKGKLTEDFKAKLLTAERAQKIHRVRRGPKLLTAESAEDSQRTQRTKAFNRRERRGFAEYAEDQSF